jgi:Carbohydrate binding module (family 6)
LVLSGCGFSELSGLHVGNRGDGAPPGEDADMTATLGGSGGGADDAVGGGGSSAVYDAEIEPAPVRPDAMDAATFCADASCHGTPFRNPTFTGPTIIPGTLEAENYDVGGQGITYHDTTAANLGGKYRIGSNEAVDVEDACSGTPGVCHDVTAIDPGEWTEYTINVAATASYSIDLGVQGSTMARLHIEVDGVNATGPITVLDSMGRFVLQPTGLSLGLTQGQHFMRLVFDDGGYSLNWIKFTAR